MQAIDQFPWNSTGDDACMGSSRAVQCNTSQICKQTSCDLSKKRRSRKEVHLRFLRSIILEEHVKLQRSYRSHITILSKLRTCVQQHIQPRHSQPPLPATETSMSQTNNRRKETTLKDPPPVFSRRICLFIKAPYFPVAHRQPQSSTAQTPPILSSKTPHPQLTTRHITVLHRQPFKNHPPTRTPLPHHPCHPHHPLHPYPHPHHPSPPRYPHYSHSPSSPSEPSQSRPPSLDTPHISATSMVSYRYS